MRSVQKTVWCQPHDKNLNFGLRKRGIMLPFVSFSAFVYFLVFLWEGIPLFADFLANKWVSSHSFAANECKKGLFIIHSLAFGGRGMFVVNIKLRLSEYRAKCRRTSMKIRELLGNSPKKGISLLFAFAIIIAIGLFSLGIGQCVFDHTCGFPGEGPNSWSNQHANLSMATWNIRSLTNERFDYCQNLNYDVLAITELWRNASKFVDGSVRFTHSTPKINEETGNPVFPDDIAAGVGILLSPRAQQKHMCHGSPCERIAWVRLKGAVTNIFVIAIYMPHRARVKPCQEDTMGSLIKLLKQVPKSDCIVALGDFNEQLPSRVSGLTGKWAYGEKSPNADSLMDVMNMFNLFAVNTDFQPKRRASTATYTFCKEGTFNPKAGNLEGRKVSCKYNGNKINGTVVSFHPNSKSWTVSFEDGYTTRCTKKKLAKWLLPPPRAKRGFKQIDYILVSRRWKSSVTNCKVDWEPSVHKSKWNTREDHALVACEWKWRIREVTLPSRTDYSGLRDGLSVPGIENHTDADKFNEEFAKRWDSLALAEKSNSDLATLDTDTVEANVPIATATTADSRTPVAPPSGEVDELNRMFNNWQNAARATAKAVLPKVQVSNTAKRSVSKRTKDLYKKKKAMNKTRNSAEEFKKLQSNIRQSSLKDFKDWINLCVNDMEQAYRGGNIRKVFKIVNDISKKPKPPPQNIKTDDQGNLLGSATDTAKAWFKFLSNKFKATPAECQRPEMPKIPDFRAAGAALTRQEFERAVATMPNHKAVGPDGIPAEAIKFCPAVKDSLFEIVQKIWELETLPQGFAQANFTMLYKNKGSSNDPSKYRCIALLNHAYKILSKIILARLVVQCGGSLQDWQAGFRPKRGCRDNTFILRTLYRRTLQLGESITVTYIDYSSAFDTVSHKFLDSALVRAGASNKVRAMFRAVYSSASAYTKVAGVDGKCVKSEVFPVRRGVVQGDITSPLYFILALDLILRKHDSRTDKGVPLGQTIIHTLGYADDVALIDGGDAQGVARASERVSAIAEGSEVDADMCINIDKTKVMHVRSQDQITSTTTEEARKTCKFTCPHLTCGFKFRTKRGMLVHAGRCCWSKEFKVKRIIDCSGAIYNRKYKIRWDVFPPAPDTWEVRGNVHPQAIKDFEIVNGRYVTD